MKSLLLIGGALGFALVFAGGSRVGRDPLSVVIEASFGCLVGAFLFRWLGNLYLQSVRTTVREREMASGKPNGGGEAEAVSTTRN
jgi:hypothetical protein